MNAHYWDEKSIMETLYKYFATSPEKRPGSIEKNRITRNILILIDHVVPFVTAHRANIEDAKQEAALRCIKALDRNFNLDRPRVNAMAFFTEVIKKTIYDFYDKKKLDKQAALENLDNHTGHLSYSIEPDIYGRIEEQLKFIEALPTSKQNPFMFDNLRRFIMRNLYKNVFSRFPYKRMHRETGISVTSLKSFIKNIRADIRT